MEKLVRDKIPEIVRKSGGLERPRVVTDVAERWEFLKQKLREETDELLDTDPAHLLDEMSDVIEVVEAMRAHFEKTSPKDLEQARKRKAEKRGQFNKFYVMDFSALAGEQEEGAQGASGLPRHSPSKPQRP